MHEEKYADRLQYLSPSSIRKMMAIARQLQQEGKIVYELNIGQPDIACIPEFSDCVARKAFEGQINYAPYIGMKHLRETYARYLNDYFDRRGVSHLVVDTENVLVTVGASHALCNTFLTICNPGDEVLCIEPFFSPYFGFLAVSGGILKSVPTKAENAFALPSEEEIQKHITPKTKALLFNSPNNPTGKIFTHEEVKRLCKVAVQNDIFIIADEVYREMIMGDTEATSILEIELDNEEENSRLRDSLIVIDSVSKSFSLCGVRIGFVIGTPQIINNVSLVNAHTVACVSDLLQHGVAGAYDAVLSKPEYLTNLRKTYRARLDATMAAIKQYLPHVIAPRPNGAFYIMIKFPEFEDITEFCYFMLEKFNIGGETVAVTPGGGFYQDPTMGNNEIRVALVVPPEQMKRSIMIISEALKAYKLFKANQNRKSL